MTDAATPAASDQGSASAAPATPPATPDATTTALLTGAAATTPPAADEAAKAAAEAEAKAKADAEAAEKAKANSAPEKYDAFNFGEGQEVKPEHVESFSALARELNLSQANAQKLVDYQSKLMQEAGAAQEEQRANLVKTWTEASNTDKEFGGEKLAENLAVANKALQQFGTPELIEFFKTTGLANHPELVRVFTRVGKALGEDGHINGGVTAKANDDRELFYGASMQPKS